MPDWVFHNMKSKIGGINIRYATYNVTDTTNRFIVFLNGRTEWIEKYDYLPADLGAKGCTGFLTWDHRGQGKSGGRRAYVNHYDSYVSDGLAIIKKVCKKNPYGMVCHSMGGLIGLYGVVTEKFKPQALVLSSPLLGMPKKPLPPVIARPVASALTKLGLGKVSSGAGNFVSAPFARNALTHNFKLYERMCASPYPCPGATFGWVKQSNTAIDRVFSKDKLSKYKTPTLVLGGSEEQVVDFDAFRCWVQCANESAQAEVMLRLLTGARHELFSESAEYYEPATQFAHRWLLDHK